MIQVQTLELCLNGTLKSMWVLTMIENDHFWPKIFFQHFWNSFETAHNTVDFFEFIFAEWRIQTHLKSSKSRSEGQFSRNALPNWLQFGDIGRKFHSPSVKMLFENNFGAVGLLLGWIPGDFKTFIFKH